MYNYKQILEWKYASSSYTILDAYNYDTLVWTDTAEKPSKELLETKIDLIKASELVSIQQLRANEYPSIQAQLDMQYWDSINGTNNWLDTITAIKTQYPKPTE